MSADLPEVWVVAKPVTRQYAGLRRALLEHGIRPEHLLVTSVEEPGGGLARMAVERGARRVVVAGGDGTVRLVAGELAGTGVELGIVPSGTGNVAARNLDLPLRAPASVAVALGCPAVPVDLGLARVDGGEAHPFLVAAGIGNDAATLGTADERLKRIAGWLAYFASGVRHLFRPGRPMSINGAHATKVWSVLVANCGRIPPGASIAPAARPDDGLLHILRVRVTNPLDWVAIAATGLAHREGPERILGRTTSRAVTVSVDQPCPVQADGDLVGVGETLHVSLLPSALAVARPAA